MQFIMTFVGVFIGLFIADITFNKDNAVMLKEAKSVIQACEASAVKGQECKLTAVPHNKQ